MNNLTHERTLQTMKIAFYITLLITIGLAISSCGRSELPTEINVIKTMHPNEAMISKYASCYGRYHDIEAVMVFFYDDRRKNLMGETLACMANISSHTVDCWGPYIREELENQAPITEFLLNAYASHEVCHLTGIINEDETDKCGNDAYEKARCW